MDPLWLVPTAVIVVAVPILAVALRALQTEIAALSDAMRGFRRDLQPALVRVRDQGAPLRQRSRRWG